MLKTRMTELLGVTYPIQCGTMQAITLAPLVSAVANAGGFAAYRQHPSRQKKN